MIGWLANQVREKQGGQGGLRRSSFRIDGGMFNPFDELRIYHQRTTLGTKESRNNRSGGVRHHFVSAPPSACQESCSNRATAPRSNVVVIKHFRSG